MNVIPSYLSFSMQNQNQKYSLGFLASVTQVVGVWSHEPKGCGFDSRSEHMPRLWV